MNELERVIKGLQCCNHVGLDCPLECPYERFAFCEISVRSDAVKLLKEYKEHEELLTKLGYHWTGSGETLALCKRSKDGEQ